MVVGRSAPSGVHTGKAVTLRPWVNFFVVVMAVVAVLVGSSAAAANGDAPTLRWIVLLGPAMVLFWFGRWWRLGVRVQATGLVERHLFSSRAIGWDEVDGARLDEIQVRGRGSSFRWYCPVLELRSGGEMQLRELRDQSTAQHAPRSRPARNVAAINDYLDHHRQNGHR